LGALHVFVFSAAFPFFNNVDEDAHFDLVTKYTGGELPRQFEFYSGGALDTIALFQSPEFITSDRQLPGGQMPLPVWRLPADEIATIVRHRESVWQSLNHESSQPPLYYAVAGLWWRLGQACHFSGERALYWLRFLNIPCVVALVWLGWRAAGSLFPENRFVRLAVPTLVACLPQSAFYSINNDILAPVTFGTVFLLAVNWLRTDEVPPRLALAAGLALAATYLTKSSTLPLLAVAAVFLAWKLASAIRQRSGRFRSAVTGALLMLAGLLPMFAWMVWCKIHFGDFSGSHLKIRLLGWTDKPLVEWLHHPLFSGPGLWFFLERNLTSFWRGELTWHREPLSLPWVDLVYIILTLGASAAALGAWLRQPSPFTAAQRAALGFAFVCLVASFVFYAFLSVKYDFHDCVYPSRAQPFLTSGRLMLGMLIPFLVWIACGLDRLTARFSNAGKWGVLLALVVFMVAGEFATDWPAFASEYNWYHL
jgi:hypothetical protein